jgi:hypothetical protein
LFFEAPLARQLLSALAGLMMAAPARPASSPLLHNRVTDFDRPKGRITRLSTVCNGIFMAINGSLAAAAAYLPVVAGA